MIQFIQIKFFNFMSTGSAGNTLILNKHQNTIISAQNGSGKSVILDAIVFGLFGKAFRDINKNQLINSINGKNCLVELDFDIDGSLYQIRRGIKPSIFEIFKDSKLIDQEAANRDYQKFLETQILKTNYNAFTQSVILGTANFTPFMQMKPHERREVIEDILDIKIFGAMNSILKNEIAETKSLLNNIDSKFSIVKTKVDAQNKLIAKLESSNNQAELVLRSKINDANTEIFSLLSQINSDLFAVSNLNDKLKSYHGVHDELNEHNTSLNNTKHSLKSIETSLKFFDKHNQCPSCKQEICDDHKAPILNELVNEYESNQNLIKIIKSNIENQSLKIKELNKIENDIHCLNNLIQNNQTKISMISKSIQQWEDEIAQLTVNDILDEKIKLKELAKSAVEIIEERTKLSDHRAVQDQAYEILRDTGVKTTIIKEYLPVINQLINKYLDIMDFYVDFHLDESFNEVIRSRGRDSFGYNSFSEGEKKRLDIAILFAWRHVAKLKNSVNCNILFLDEIMDGPVDEIGMDSIFQIIEEESKYSNVFVISHAERFKDRFSDVITIEKVGDFSVITQN